MPADGSLHPDNRQAEACPVAALADEAADLIAAWNGVTAARRALAETEAGNVGIGQILGETIGPDDEELTARSVSTELGQRIKAIIGLAAHRTPASAKGAAFQALAMKWDLIDMHDAGTDTIGDPRERETLEDAYNSANRALVSVFRFLNAAGGLPPHVVEYFLMDACDSAGDAADRAVRRFARA